jgi:hypothetical protein
MTVLAGRSPLPRWAVGTTLEGVSQGACRGAAGFGPATLFILTRFAAC